MEKKDNGTIKNIAILVLSGVVLILAVSMLSKGDGRKKGSGTEEGTQQAEQQIPEEIEFSKKSGVYEEEFSLKLSGKKGKIYYTLDGSNPCDSDSRIEYKEEIAIGNRDGEENVISATDPVLFDGVNVEWDEDKGEYVSTLKVPDKDEVDKITVVKAVVEKEDGSYCPVQTQSYFTGKMADHIEGIEESCKAAGTSLAVVSISMEYKDLFDEEKGIYVKGNKFKESLKKYQETKEINSWEAVEISRRQDANYKQRGKAWERPAHIDYFESNGKDTECKLQQDCGIRIQGNYSRSDLQKGFRLCADEIYGQKNFEYEFFGEDALNDNGEPVGRYKKLVLRNGGNCAFTTKYSDTYWQSLVKDLACETQASRPCIVYLNGEYWGLYILQEDYNDNYFQETHGVDDKAVIAYKGDAETYQIGYKLDEGEIPSGEGVSYYFQDLLDFYDEHEDLTQKEDYEAFEKLVDVDSVRDYFAVNVWVNNKWDWPGKNWTAWKVSTVDESNPYADGRWRLCFYDLDFGGVSGAGEAYTNTIKEDNYQEYGLLDKNTGNPVVLMFAYLMTNEEFRQSFAERLDYLSENNFKKEEAVSACTVFKDTYAPLYPQFYARYMGKEKAEELTNNAIEGGYASYKCIVDFLEERENHIKEMMDWVQEVYKDL